jgi:homoserine kinase
MKNAITVKVPATSANMGPGFDCIGIALDIWNSIRVNKTTESSSQVNILGKGQEILDTNEDNLVLKSFNHLFTRLDQKPPIVSIECDNKIPLASGMGSSSAALVGGLYAANAYAGNPFSKHELLDIAAEREGHIDNVAPAIFGGMQIGIYEDDLTHVTNVPIHSNDLKAILFVPDVPMLTSEARALLEDQVSRTAAIFNIARSALLVHAFITGEWDNLVYATQDMIHQPYRQKTFFPMKNIIRAALNSGAVGAFLSGSGPTVLAFCLDREYTIGYEMADAAMRSGVNGEILVTKATQKGVFDEN